MIRKQTKIAALRWFIFFLLKGYYYGFFKYYSGDDFFQLCADMILLKTRYEHIKSFYIAAVTSNQIGIKDSMMRVAFAN